MTLSLSQGHNGSHARIKVDNRGGLEGPERHESGLLRKRAGTLTSAVLQRRTLLAPPRAGRKGIRIRSAMACATHMLRKEAPELLYLPLP